MDYVPVMETSQYVNLKLDLIELLPIQYIIIMTYNKY